MNHASSRDGTPSPLAALERALSSESSLTAAAPESPEQLLARTSSPEGAHLIGQSADFFALRERYRSILVRTRILERLDAALQKADTVDEILRTANAVMRFLNSPHPRLDEAHPHPRTRPHEGSDPLPAPGGSSTSPSPPVAAPRRDNASSAARPSGPTPAPVPSEPHPIPGAPAVSVPPEPSQPSAPAPIPVATADIPNATSAAAPSPATHPPFT